MKTIQQWCRCLLAPFQYSLLKGTLAWDFFVLVFCTYRTHIGQILRLLNVFDFVLEFANLFEFFKHLAVTQLTRSLQCQVSLYVNWVNAEWDYMSTESTQNDKIFVNVGVFCVDSVDVESHSTLTQLTWSLTPRLLSWRRVWLRVNSVWGRWLKPKQAYITSSFKGIVFRKINDEMFEWGLCEPENVNSLYIALTKN